MTFPNYERRSILEERPDLREFMLFLGHLNDESERGQVLICCSMLEDLLGQLIGAFLIEGKSSDRLLNGAHAPLASFSSRIDAAHALGLLPDTEFQDACKLRKIRNKFAHQLSVSFTDDSVKDQCGTLNHKAHDYDEVVVPARGQFSTATTALVVNIINRINNCEKDRAQMPRNNVSHQ
tara:strand:- start:3245 stop:3781 length:537 start_codon:yes stop_codon:yes gene_type:complete